MDLKSVTAVALAVLLSSGGALVITGCEKKGPAESAGEKVDRAVEDLKDAVDPPGPSREGRTVRSTAPSMT